MRFISCIIIQAIVIYQTKCCESACSTCIWVCLACKSGYYYNDLNCIPCTSNCQNCDQNNCHKCYDGYLLNANACYPCTKPCASCSQSLTTCDTCMDTQKQTPPQCNCVSGYLMNTSSYLCQQCTFPCDTCQIFVTNCQTCVASYTYNSGTCQCQDNQYEQSGTPKTCQNCTSPCKTCSISNTNCNSCLEGLNRHLSNYQCICDDGFYENTVCVLCQLPCIWCTSASVCTYCYQPTLQLTPSCSCQATYYMDASFSCQNCISPCQNCDSPSVCTSCVSNYYISGNTCYQCDIPCYNCVDLATKCTSCAYTNQLVQNNQCICADGYYMDGSLHCQPCTHPCSKCETYSNYCIACASTYIMSTTVANTCECPAQNYEVLTNTPNNCEPCTQPCKSCTGTSVQCLTCIDIQQTVDASNECKCNDGYLMSGVNCVVCINPCTKCSGSTTFCTQCKDSQHYLNNGKCICNDGWVLNNNYDCIACQAPCVTCSVNTTHCTRCMDTNHLINTTFQCYCKDTYYSNTANTCAPCILPCKNCNINGCLTCIDSNQTVNSSKQCICNPGYYMSGVNCSQCNIPCKTCEINQNHCLTCIDINQSQINNLCICNDGYYEVSNYCQKCQYPCTKCEFSKDHCLECLDLNHDLINNECICKYGYGSSGNGGINCSQCLYPCLDCSTSVKTCLSCMDNSLYHLQDDQCLCQDDYYQIDQQCKKCSPECSTCVSQSDLCLSCSDLNHDFIQNSCICKFGYYTDIEMKCSECQFPCVTCVLNHSYCTSCYYDNQSVINGQCICDHGYYFSGLICKQCNQICTTCNSYFECTGCKDEYYLSNTSCLKCQKPCQTCLNIDICKSCSEHYYMDQMGQCIECISNCKYCIDTTSCIQCDDSFFYENELCIPCFDKCKTCENTSYFCTSCIDMNQELIDNQCICKDGYYEENYHCMRCNYSCKLCHSLSFCTECNSIHHIILVNNQCICQDGFYDNNKICLICDQSCQTCFESATHCLSCNEQKNRVLHQNSCICQIGYFENYQNICWSCNSNEGKEIKDCKYKDCTDLIWTYGEECDDGNNITRDGCSNCKVDHNYSCINTILEPSLCFPCSENCSKCQLNQILKKTDCILCEEGFFLLDNMCAKCVEKCLTCEASPSNCITCRYLKNAKEECQICDSLDGQYTDHINNKCYSTCGDAQKSQYEECDDGNLISNDGCNSNCKIEKKYICKDANCIIPGYPIPQLISYEDTSLYNNQRLFKLTYNALLNITQNSSIENEIELFIRNEYAEKPIDFLFQKTPEYSLNNQSQINFTIVIQLKLNRSSKKEELILKYNNLTKFISYQGYSQQESSISIIIPEYMFISQDSVAQVQVASNSNTYVLYAMGTMSGSAILFGGLDIFYNLLDTIQMLSYLKYINSQFPYNLEEFFNLFGFAQLNFISKYLNIQGLIDPYIPYEDLKHIPLRIENDDLNSLFIINGSSVLLVWLSLFLIYGLSKIIPQILYKFKCKYYTDVPDNQNISIKLKIMFLSAKLFIIQLCYVIISEFFYSGMFRTLLATAYDYSFSLTLQIYALELHSQNVFICLSSYLALLALGIYLLAIYIVIKISGGSRLSQKQYQNKLKYGSLLEGIKKEQYSKYFNAVLLTKKLFFMFILIFCYSSPFIQVINLTLLSFLQSIFLILYKPLDDEKEYKKQLSCEINTTSSLILISSLVLDGELKNFSDDLKTTIGWLCIANITLIFAIQLIIDAIQQWTLLIKKYKKLKRIIQKINQLFHSSAPAPQQQNHDIFTKSASPIKQ